jgi:hypothetical protein
MDEQVQYKVGSAINKSGAGSDITPEKIGENIKTTLVLKEYAAALDNEGGDLTAIKNQQAVLQVDYTRAIASINAAASLYGIDLKSAKEDGARAAAAMQKGMGIDKKEAEDKAVGNKEAVSQLTNKANDFNAEMGILKSRSLDVKAQVAAMKGATAKFRVHTLTKEIPEKQAELNKAKADEAAIKSVVSSVTTAALAALGAESMVKFELPSITGEGAMKSGKDLASKGAQFLLDDVKENLIDGPITKAISDLTGLTHTITSLSTSLGKLTAEQEAQSDLEANAALEQARALLEKSLNDYNVARKKADNLKAQLRDEWEKLGKAMDKQSGGGEKYALIAKTVGECDAFFGQAQKIYDTITSWQEVTRKETSDKKENINSANKNQGLKAYEFILADAANRIYGLVEHPITISSFALNTNEGHHPVEQAKLIKNDLRVMGTSLMNYRNNIVQNALGINVPYPEVSFLKADEDNKQ